MEKRFYGVFRWILYGFLLFCVAVIQRVILGNVAVFGTTLSLLPVAVAAVACQNNHQDGALVGLAVGLFWGILGQSSGAAFILFLTIGGALAGWFCTHYMTRGIGATTLLSALCLALCEGGIVVLKLYMGDVLPPHFLQLVLIQILASCLVAPLLCLLCRGVERMVEKWKRK